MPRVLMLTGAYPPEVSGGGVQCRALAGALRGCATFAVVSTTHDPDLPARDAVDGVPVWRFGVRDVSPLSGARAAAGLLRRLLSPRLRFDVMHLHGFSAKSLLAVVAARLRRTPIVLTVHTAGYDDPDSQRRRRLGALRLALYRSIDRFVVVSPDLRRRCIASGLPPARVLEIPNGVDCARFRPAAGAREKAALRAGLSLPDDRPVLLFVGFFSRDKGPHLAVEAWQRARRDGRRPVLVMVGSTDPAYHEVDGDLVRRIRELQGSAGNDLRLVERAIDMPVYYRAADLFVLPSIREACPLSLLEAMASGLACVAFRLDGATDAIIDDGEGGILVPAGDGEALSAAVSGLLATPAAAERLGRGARRVVERRYALPAIAAAYLRCYEELLAAARTTPPGRL